jgi:branched-chain amino acid transport system substrate-binding protein
VSRHLPLDASQQREEPIVNSHKHGRTRAALAAIATCSLLAAACGGDDDDATVEPAAESTDAPAASSTEDPAAESTEESDGSVDDSTAGSTADSTAGATDGSGAADGTPIKIGLVYAETGRTASTYSMTDGVAKAWAQWVNEEMGGVNGHPVEIVAEDGLSTGEGAVAAAQKLIDEGVVGIVVQDSTAENAILETITAAGIPMIGGTANNRPVDSGDAHWPNTFFPTSPGNPATAAGPLLATSAAGLTSFSAAVCSEVPACAEAGGLYEAVGPGLGVEFEGLVTVGAADPSYTAPCLELVNLGAEVINLALTSQTAQSVISECQLQGFEGAFAATNNSVTAPDYESLDIRLIGAINGFPWWADAEPVQTFRDVNERYGDGDDVRNPSATNTWSALELFRKAMGDNGPAADAEVTAADVIGVYQNISGESLDGLLPAPADYVADGFQPGMDCLWLFEMQGGEFSSLAVGDSGNGASGDLQSTCFQMG